MKIVGQKEKISSNLAEEYIMLVAKFGDNIVNKPQHKFYHAKDWKIKETIYSLNYDYRKIKEKCRYPYQEPIPFIHNLITAGGIWQVSGGKLSLKNEQTGTEEEILKEDGIASLNNYATSYEKAHKSLIKISEDQQYDEILSLVIYGVISIEAFISYLVDDFNKHNPTNLLKDSKASKISFDDKIDKWIPLITQGRRFDKSSKIWKDFKYIQNIRDSYIHPKHIKFSFSISEIVDILKKFKNGISGFLIELHKMKNNILIPTTIIRDFYTPDFYIKEVNESEKQSELLYKKLPTKIINCSIKNEENPYFIIKDVQEKLKTQVSDIPELIKKTKRAILLFSDYLIAHEILLTLYFKLNDYDNIIKSSKKLFELDNINELALYCTGIAHYKKNSYGNALTFFLRICDKSKTLDSKTHVEIKDYITNCFNEILKTPYWGNNNHSYSENFSKIVEKIENIYKLKILMVINPYKDTIEINGLTINNYILILSNKLCSEEQISSLLIKYLSKVEDLSLLSIYPNTGKIPELVQGQTDALINHCQYNKLIHKYGLENKIYKDFEEFNKLMGNEIGILNSDIARVFILLSLIINNNDIYTKKIDKIKTKYKYSLEIARKLEPYAREMSNEELKLRLRRRSIINFFQTLTLHFVNKEDINLANLIMVKPVFNSLELSQTANSVFEFQDKILINKTLGVTLSGIKLKEDNQLIQSGVWKDNEKSLIKESIEKNSVFEFLKITRIPYFIENE